MPTLPFRHGREELVVRYPPSLNEATARAVLQSLFEEGHIPPRHYNSMDTLPTSIKVRVQGWTVEIEERFYQVALVGDDVTIEPV